MTELDLLIGAAAVGAMVPISLGMIYWFAVDQAKRYTDQEIRKTKRELREYARDQS